MLFPVDARLEPDAVAPAGAAAAPEEASAESPACAVPPAAVVEFGDALDVIAVLIGSTTAATSGGNSCVSKRGNQK
jgi:hypothetical protein